MRTLTLLAVIALVACGGQAAGVTGDDAGADASGDSSPTGDAAEDGGAADASADTLLVSLPPGSSCPGDILLFGDVRKTCMQASDCAVVFQQVDCCGTLEAVGVDSSSVAAFDADEPRWVAMCPACHCAPGATFAENGDMAASMSGFQATCTAGMCTTYAP